MSGEPNPKLMNDTRFPAIAGKEAELAKLCRGFHVRTLELFGSAAGDAFDHHRSDIDFLVEFEPLAPELYATSFFGFKEALEKLFGREVDLVVASAIRNPYFRQSVEQGRALLYAA